MFFYFKFEIYNEIYMHFEYYLDILEENEQNLYIKIFIYKI